MCIDDMTKPRELTIEWRGLSLAALEWGHRDDPKVMALHGWMDNAASFVPLASRLSGLHIIAPDFVGHGLSDHRPALCGAHFIDWVADVLGMAKTVGWSSTNGRGGSRDRATPGPARRFWPSLRSCRGGTGPIGKSVGSRMPSILG